MMENLVSIKTYLSRHEAELAKGLLDEKGIEAIISVDDLGTWRPHLTFSEGVKLLVKKGDVEKAREALRIIES